mgnify:CR=1 FL=1
MISISANLNIMIKAAEKASKSIIRDFGEVEKLQVSKKGPNDFVTKTDKHVEKILIEELSKAKKNFSFIAAIKTASGMSLISMLSMEVMMNLTDYFLTGGAMLTWWVVPIMLIVGFLTPWPYNYWRLKKFNQACH